MPRAASGLDVGPAYRTALLDDARVFSWLALLGFTLALLRAVRMPNLWSATQASIDYAHGFTRRGLFGELLRQLHVPGHRYAVFVVVAYLVLAGCFAGCLCLSRRVGLFRSAQGAALGALFFGSYATSSLMDMVGYFDPLLIVLAFAALAPRAPRVQLLCAALASVLCVLVHEQFTPAFFALVLLPATFRLLASPRLDRWLALGLPLVAVAVLGLTWYVSNASSEPDQVAAIQRSIAARVDFPLRADFFGVLGSTTASNRQKMLELYHAPWWRELFTLGALLTLPTIVLLVAGSLRRVGAIAQLAGVRLWLLRAAVVGASLAPLSLHFVAWDALRWDAQAIVSSFGVLLVTYQQAGGVEQPRTAARERFGLLVLSVMLLNAAAGGGLEAGRGGVFPYRDGLRELEQRLQSGNFFAPR